MPRIPRAGEFMYGGDEDSQRSPQNEARHGCRRYWVLPDPSHDS